MMKQDKTCQNGKSQLKQDMPLRHNGTNIKKSRKIKNVKLLVKNIDAKSETKNQQEFTLNNNFTRMMWPYQGSLMEKGRNCHFMELMALERNLISPMSLSASSIDCGLIGCTSTYYTRL